MFRIVLLVIVFLPSVCCADLYQWTDENGVKHFSNTPPPEAAGAVRQMEELEGDYEPDPGILKKTLDLFQSGAEQESPPPKPKARHRPTVVMYTTPTCGYCHRAKAYFNERDIQFTERDVTQSSLARRQFKALNGRGVPLIIIGDQRIPGFNKAAIERALGLP